MSPEPWLTPWAFALYALALMIGLVYGAVRLRVRTLREDAPLHSLEGMQVELAWTPGPQVAAEDRTAAATAGSERTRR
jgi:hypothetical protein